MKKILSILGAITLIGTSSTSLVACNKNEYSAEELKELKEKNKINTKDKTIRDNLEGMASQETPFNKVDNKGYYVVWRGEKNKNGILSKFNNIYKSSDPFFEKELDKQNNVSLCLKKDLGGGRITIFIKNGKKEIYWAQKVNDDYFKSVYRGNLDTKEPELILDKDGNLKVKGE